MYQQYVKDMDVTDAQGFGPRGVPENAEDADYDESTGAGRTVGGERAPGSGPGTGAGDTPDSLPVDDFTYRMDRSKRGIFPIINNRDFDPATKMKERSGTDLDAVKLHHTFKALGFEPKIHQNQTCREMLNIMERAASDNHSDSDCFACAILTHGDEGVLYGTDGMMKVDTLINCFKGSKCRGLVGKPKLFFIQACRGKAFDDGVEVADGPDDEEHVKRIPGEADFLFAFSTTPGYFSWRNMLNGSWFVQALCKVLKEHGNKAEIMWMLTRVNKLVAEDKESSTHDEAMNRKKQIPSIVSQLTKQLYFPPKA